MKKSILSLVALSFAFVFFAQFAQAQESSTVSELNARLDVLIQRFEALLVGPNTIAPNTGAASITSTIRGQGCAIITRHLQIGSSGSDVSDLQRALKEKSYFTHPTITGYFGPLTQEAVRKFQSAEGIVSSGDASITGYGAVGPKTRAALSRYCASTTGTGTTVETGFSMSVSSPTTGQSVGDTVDVIGSGYGTPTNITANGVEADIDMLDITDGDRVAATYSFKAEDVPVSPLNSLVAYKYNGLVEVVAEGYSTTVDDAAEVVTTIIQSIEVVIDDGSGDPSPDLITLEEVSPNEVALGEDVNIYGEGLSNVRRVSIFDGYYIFERDDSPALFTISDSDTRLSFQLPAQMQGTCGDIKSTSGGVLNCFVSELAVEVGTYDLVVEDEDGNEYGPVKFEVVSDLDDE